MPRPRRRATSAVRLAAIAATALGVLLFAEWVSSRLVTQEQSIDEPGDGHAKNVTVVSKYAENLEPPSGRPSVWMFGNSHTYALPGLKQGEPLRAARSGISIDELSERFAAAHPGVPVDFYLMAYPNFLPFEMLTRAGHALYMGYRPKYVIIGLTWRNLARDSLPRHIGLPDLP